MKKGQILLIMMVITAFIMVVMSAALAMSLAGLSATTNGANATTARYAADSGLENGLMRILRDPGYTGDTLTVGTTTVTITVTGSTPYLITAVATAGNVNHTSQVNAEFVNGVMTVTNWKDTY